MTFSPLRLAMASDSIFGQLLTDEAEQIWIFLNAIMQSGGETETEQKVEKVFFTVFTV